MPLIHVTSNLTLSDAEKSNALKTLSQAVAELLDKPEKPLGNSRYPTKHCR